MRLLLIIAILGFYSCNSGQKDVQEEMSSRISLQADAAILELDFEDENQLDQLTISTDVACKIGADLKAGDFAYRGSGVLVSSVQNTRKTLTTKARIIVTGDEFFEGQRWLGFAFMVPSEAKVEPSNYGKGIQLLRILDTIANRDILSLELVRKNDTINYLGLRYGQERKLVAVKEDVMGRWNKVVLNIGIIEDNDTFVAAWINSETFTPVNGSTNRIFGAAGTDITYRALYFGQQRNWKDLHPSIVYFDEFRIGQSVEEVSDGKLNLYNAE